MGIWSEGPQTARSKEKKREAPREKKRPPDLARLLCLDAHTKRTGNFFFSRGFIRTQEQTAVRKPRPQDLARPLCLDAHRKRTGKTFFGQGIIRTQERTVRQSRIVNSYSQVGAKPQVITSITSHLISPRLLSLQKNRFSEPLLALNRKP
jgi:hypothetical protein